MRSPIRILAGFVAGLVLACTVCGQNPFAPPPETPEQRAAKAIKSYQEAKKDPKKATLARKQLLWLGEIDHESVTEFLKKELAKTGVSSRSLVVLQAIARASRPSLEEPVWRVLTHPKAPFIVHQASASALIAMGKTSIDRLLKLLTGRAGAITELGRQAIIRAAAGRNNKRALRGVVPLFEDGSTAEELAYLRLLDPVDTVPEISALRARLVVDGPELVASVAWRQLMEEGDSRGPERFRALRRRFPKPANAAVAIELIVGISLLEQESFYPFLLRYGAMKGRGVKQAVRRAATYVAEDPFLIDFLVREGLDSDRLGEREVAMALLQRASLDAVRPVIERVRKALRRPRKSSLDLAVGLHPLLAKDPTWVDDLAKLAESPVSQIRTAGLSLLLDLESDRGLVFAQRGLSDKAWELRTVAIRYLTRFRSLASIPLLISRVGKEGGRLSAELSNALFVHTGTRCYGRAEWFEWWRKHKNGFELPHEKTIRSGTGGVAGQTSAYYGIPLVSDRVAFLVDTSGSMAAQITTDKKQTRLKLAKSELRRVLADLPRNFRLNLIWYHSGVESLWPDLRPASRKNKEDVRESVEDMATGGGTNIYGALEAAFEDPEIDTIYLLTDGQPSTGDIVDPVEIADQVARWNRLRQVVIHCIGLGIDSPLLKRLAEESGGVYKYVR